MSARLPRFAGIGRGRGVVVDHLVTVFRTAFVGHAAPFVTTVRESVRKRSFPDVSPSRVSGFGRHAVFKRGDRGRFPAPLRDEDHLGQWESRSPRASARTPLLRHVVRGSEPRPSPAVRSSSASRLAHAPACGFLSRRRSTSGIRGDCSSGNRDSRSAYGRKSCRFLACICSIACLYYTKRTFSECRKPL